MSYLGNICFIVAGLLFIYTAFKGKKENKPFYAIGLAFIILGII